MKINGELLANGLGFVAYKDSIRSWEHPNDNEEISEVIKEQIIAHVLEESKKSKIKIHIK